MYLFSVHLITYTLSGYSYRVQDIFITSRNHKSLIIHSTPTSNYPFLAYEGEQSMVEKIWKEECSLTNYELRVRDRALRAVEKPPFIITPNK